MRFICHIYKCCSSVIQSLILGAAVCCSSQLVGQAVSESVKRPELIVQSGHAANMLSAVALSANLEWLVTGGSDGQIVLWNYLTRQEVRAIPVHKAPLAAIAITSSGDHILSAGNDKSVVLTNALTGMREAQFHTASIPVAVSISKDGQLLSWTDGKAVKIWRKTDAIEKVRTISTFTTELSFLRFTPDQKALAVGTSSGIAGIIKVNERASFRLLSRHPSAIGFISAKSDMVVSGSADGTACVTSQSKRKDQHCFNTGAPIYGLGIMPDSSIMSVGVDDNDTAIQISKWNASTGQDLGHTALPIKITRGLFTLSVNWPINVADDGMHIAYALDFNTVATANPLIEDHEIQFPTVVTASLALSTGQHHQWVAVASGKNIQIWSPFTGEARLIATDYTQSIRRLIFNENESTVTAISDAEELDVFDVHTGRSQLRFRGGQPKDSNGTAVAAPAGSDVVKVWNVDPFDKEHPRIVHAKHIYGIDRISISPDGRFLASATQLGDEVKLWDIQLDKEIESVPHSGFTRFSPLQFSSDSSVFGWAAFDGSIRVIDLQSHQMSIFCCHAPRWAAAIAFSPDHKLVASGGEDHTIKIWRLDSRLPIQKQPMAVLEGHSAGVRSLAFISKDALLLSASEDGTAKVWDYTSKEALATLFAFQDRAGWLAVSSEGLFDGTATAIHNVGWRIPNTNSVYPVGAFYNDFYYPGLMAEIFEGKMPHPCLDISALLRLPGAHTMALQRLLRIDFRQKPPQLCLPEKPDDSFFDGIDIKWRGLPVPLSGSSFREQDVPGCEYAADLPAGAAYVDINGTDTLLHREIVKSCSVRNDDFRHSDALEFSPSLPKGILYSAFIAINKYPSQSGGYDPLAPSVVTDAQQLNQLLAGRTPLKTDVYSGKKDWPTLTNQIATRRGIESRLQEILTNARPEDTVFLFLSGHGRVPPGQEQFYFIPFDGKLNSESETALSTAMLADFIRQLRARRVLMMIDACQSAGALDSLARILAARRAADRRMQVLNDNDRSASRAAIHIIAAASPFQSALIVNGADLFSQSLLETLEASREGTQDLLAQTLAEAVGERLRKKTESLSSSQTLLPLSDGFDFVVIGH